MSEFANIQTQKLAGAQWFQPLPQRPRWGSGRQRQPQDECCNTGVDGLSIGQLRFIRNIWVHREQSLRDGHFCSEEEIVKTFLESFPWLVTELYQLCDKNLQGEMDVWVQKYC